MQAVRNSIPAMRKAAPDAEGLRTQLAAAAVNAADVVNVSLQNRSIGNVYPRRLQVQLPEGVSTEGGKKARQSINLVAISGDQDALMCGWMDVSKKKAELRNFPTLAHQHEQRFGEPLDLSAADYEAVMQEVARLLRTLSFQVQFQGYEAVGGQVHLRRKEAKKRTLPVWAGALIGIAAGGVLAVGLGVAAALLTR